MFLVNLLNVIRNEGNNCSWSKLNFQLKHQKRSVYFGVSLEIIAAVTSNELGIRTILTKLLLG